MPDILDSGLSFLAPGSSATSPELEILAARRAFSVAQAMLSGAPIGAVRSIDLGWYDTSVNRETGSFGLIDTDSGLDDLIGEIVSVTLNNRVVFVYVLQAASLPTPFGITRRSFAAICRLSAESVGVKVAAVQ